MSAEVIIFVEKKISKELKNIKHTLKSGHPYMPQYKSEILIIFPFILLISRVRLKEAAKHKYLSNLLVDVKVQWLCQRSPRTVCPGAGGLDKHRWIVEPESQNLLEEKMQIGALKACCTKGRKSTLLETFCHSLWVIILLYYISQMVYLSQKLTHTTPYNMSHQ